MMLVQFIKGFEDEQNKGSQKHWKAFSYLFFSPQMFEGKKKKKKKPNSTLWELSMKSSPFR